MLGLSFLTFFCMASNVVSEKYRYTGVSEIDLPVIAKSVLKDNMQEITEVASFLSHVFTTREPVVSFMDFGYAGFLDFCTYVCQESAKDGLGIIVRDAETQELLGCNIGIDRTLEVPVLGGSDAIRQKSEILGKLLDAVIAPLNVSSLEKGQCLHFHLSATKESLQKYGLATLFRSENARNALSKGYVYGVVEASNPASVKSYVNIGATVENQIVYEDFEFDGKKPFKGLSGCLSYLRLDLAKAVEIADKIVKWKKISD